MFKSKYFVFLRDEKNISDCYMNYGHFCQDRVYVDDVKKAVHVLEHICNALFSGI